MLQFSRRPLARPATAPIMAPSQLQRVVVSRLGVAARRGRVQVARVVAAAETVPVTVSVAKKVKFGETLKLVGNQPSLGDWEQNKAADLAWGDGDVWNATLQAPVGVDIAFKVIRVKPDGGCVWEGGDNRTFKALGPDYALQIKCTWGDTASTAITAVPLNAAGSTGVLSVGRSNNGTGSNNIRTSSGSTSSSTATGTLDTDARSTGAWVGAAPVFVRSRQDKRDRDGAVWRLDGLDGVEAELVKGDQSSGNWLSKLALLKTLLVDRAHMLRPDVGTLAAAYVYATWINNGAIQCVESGGHHRPNHHANAALLMFRSLEWVITDATAAAGADGPGSDADSGAAAARQLLAARRMHTRLPSIAGEFRVSTPLTRIRDIAHRNDIPKDLKDEIKHTLQNKLHRSAGPEDLVATEAMLARITAQPGQYSQPFVEEFKIFTRELRDFFNAAGLTELLQATEPALEDRHRGAVAQFTTALAKVPAGDGGGGAGDVVDAALAALAAGTHARAHYAAGLASGLRNDVGDDVLAMRQKWRLAEIRLEDHAFVLLARIVGALEAGGGATGLLARPGSAGAWRAATAATVQGLRHLGLSGAAPAKELLALENELEAWMKGAQAAASGGGDNSNNGNHRTGVAASRDEALRGKAWAERVQRLASRFSDLVMAVYAGPSARLGVALGVPPHMASVFGEAEVRASVAFQVSRLASLMVRALRSMAGLEAWDGLVTGDAVGRLVSVPRLSPEAMEGATAGLGPSERVVLLVAAADGDEEVGALGDRLAGVVLAQDLPHLSHLGVRARQEGVPFATCDDAQTLDSQARPLLGQAVRLSVRPDGVTLLPAAGGTYNTAHSSSGEDDDAPADPAPARRPPPDQQKQRSAGSNAKPGPTQKTRNLEVVPLAAASAETCGAKAAKCGELERLARSSGLFTTPPGAVLPFGVMDVALPRDAAADLEDALRQLDDPTAGTIDAAAQRAQAAVQRATLPADFITRITAAVQQGSAAKSANGSGGPSTPLLLAVRSSANVEDLAGMSAAGLYESVVGVPASDPGAVADAVTAVWASLYSRRAVLARRVAGVRQADASMAVLVMALVAPELSFVLHTARPSDANRGVLLAELAPGQGETLAAGTRGSPWRLEVEKATSTVTTRAFANFSHALVPRLAGPPGGGVAAPSAGGPLRYASFDEQQAQARLGGAGSGGGATTAAPTAAPSQQQQQQQAPSAGSVNWLQEVEVDYSRQRLSTDGEFRDQVGRLLARVGMAIETHYGGQPQDIEGGLVAVAPGDPRGPGGLNAVIVQTRPQL